MTDNTQRFTGRAQDYDLYRQRYPAEEVLAHLRAWCGLEPDWLIADIGAGTGMLAEVFLENSNRVLAIEPNPDMRDQMHASFDRLGPCWPRIEVIDATAEATTLPDASIDMVAAGRAFHWFDKDRALAEFRRILKPAGWVALVSAGRTRLAKDHAAADSEFREQLSAFERLLTEHGTDYTYVRSGYRVHDNMQALFGPDAELLQAQLPGTQQLDWSAFHGNAMSLSVVPQPDHHNFETFQRGLRMHFDNYAEDSILTVPTTCWITAARFQPQ
jgi:ubiquinone/menaquinone biosynthesis C-methylase UbiE